MEQRAHSRRPEGGEGGREREGQPGQGGELGASQRGHRPPACCLLLPPLRRPGTARPGESLPPHCLLRPGSSQAIAEPGHRVRAAECPPKARPRRSQPASQRQGTRERGGGAGHRRAAPDAAPQPGAASQGRSPARILAGLRGARGRGRGRRWRSGGGSSSSRASLSIACCKRAALAGPPFRPRGVEAHVERRGASPVAVRRRSRCLLCAPSSRAETRPLKR